MKPIVLMTLNKIMLLVFFLSWDWKIYERKRA
jgi:hypothetical protein